MWYCLNNFIKQRSGFFVGIVKDNFGLMFRPLSPPWWFFDVLYLQYTEEMPSLQVAPPALSASPGHSTSSICLSRSLHQLYLPLQVTPPALSASPGRSTSSICLSRSLHQLYLTRVVPKLPVFFPTMQCKAEATVEHHTV